MKILVLGSNGQLGCEIVNYFQNSNYKFSFFNSNELNILDFDKVNEIFLKVQPDIVINAAAYTNVDGAESNNKIAFNINANAAKNLALCANRIEAFLIHFSTDFVFDGISANAYSENSKPNPLNIYGASKLEGDYHIQNLSEKYLILRVSWVFSSHGKNFLNTILNLAKTNKELKIINDQFGCPTSTLSIVKVLEIIIDSYIKNKNLKFGLYNFSNFDVVNWHDFAEYIINQSHIKKVLKSKPLLTSISSYEFKQCATRPKFSALSNKKIMKEFKIKKSYWKHEVDKIIEKFSC